MNDFTAKQAITRETIESLIMSAIEGGSNYWYRIESDTNGDYLKQAFTDQGLTISNFMVQDEDEAKSGVLNPASMQRALDLMPGKYNHILADIISGNEDAISGDVFLQLAVFGECIYG